MGKTGFLNIISLPSSKYFAPLLHTTVKKKGKTEKVLLLTPLLLHPTYVTHFSWEGAMQNPMVASHSMHHTLCDLVLAPEESQQIYVLICKMGIKVVLGFWFNGILHIKRREPWLRAADT